VGRSLHQSLVCTLFHGLERWDNVGVFLETMCIGRINLRRLSVALVSLKKQLPREREPGTMHRPLVCCGGAYGLPGRCQKNPSL